MTKLKELIEMHDRVDGCYVTALKNKKTLEDAKEEYNKLLIIQKAQYKTLLDFVKEPLERNKKNGLIRVAEENYEQSVMNIYNLQQECTHEILMLIDVKKTSDVVRTYYCPICNSKIFKLGKAGITNSNIIDESKNPDKDKFFGPCREIEIELLSRMKRFLITQEEITVEDFFDEYSKESPQKCKKKMM